MSIIITTDASGKLVVMQGEMSGGTRITPDRKDKGKSLWATPTSFVVVDIETTGLDSSYDEIIELAAIRVVDGQFAEQFQTLVRPECEIDGFIADLTGITNAMVVDAPSIEEVLPHFLTFIGNDTLLGHNVNFDINFIYDACVAHGLPPIHNDFVDTMRLARRAYPEWQHHRLKDLVEAYDVDTGNLHRALADCAATMLCYEQLKKHIEENDIYIGPRTKNDLKAKDIVAQTDVFDPDSPIYGKVFVFTGTLERMIRRDAMQLVVDAGGRCGDNVTKETNYLVLGNNDYCTTIKGGKSSKQKKTEKLQLAGEDIQIISENVFYDMLEQ